jgi:hypothetical protein
MLDPIGGYCHSKRPCPYIYHCQSKRPCPYIYHCHSKRPCPYIYQTNKNLEKGSNKLREICADNNGRFVNTGGMSFCDMGT